MAGARSRFSSVPTTIRLVVAASEGHDLDDAPSASTTEREDGIGDVLLRRTVTTGPCPLVFVSRGSSWLQGGLRGRPWPAYDHL